MTLQFAITLPNSAIAQTVPSVEMRVFGTAFEGGPYTVQFDVGSVAVLIPGTESYFWDFGDGTTSTLENPTHTYADVGDYVVSLTVFDPAIGASGTSATDTQTVTIIDQLTEFTGAPFFGCAPVTTNFTSTLGASVAQTEWDFGDGNTSTDANPSHTYDQPGVYSVTLTTRMADGTLLIRRTRSNYVQTIGPSVNFSANSTAGTFPFAVDFTDMTVFGAPITQWEWDFGDGNTSRQRNPTHTYAAAGTYDVTLSIRDIDGCFRSVTQSALIDVSAPGTTITAPASVNTLDPFDVIVTFDPDVTGFTTAGLTLANATASISGSGGTYTVTLTPDGTGDVSITVDAGAAVYGPTNAPSAASATSTITVDTMPPTVSFAGAPATVTGNIGFPLTIDFSEDVTGFSQSDINVTGATLSGFGGTGDSYTVFVTPTTGSITLSVPAGVATDAVGNSNLASADLVLDNTIVADSQRVIAEFMATRANNLASHQPDLVGLLTGGRQGRVSIQASQGQLNFDIGTGGDGPVWFDLRGARTEEAGAESFYTLLSVGTHMSFSDGTLLGLMAQLDRQETEDGLALTEGTGWLVGPYAVAQWPGQPMFVDARLLWGRTENEVTPFGTYTDAFETERLLAQVGVSGQFELDTVTLRPRLSAIHIADRQASYVDGLSNLIPEQTISLTQISLGLGADRSITMGGEDWILGGGLFGFYNDISGSGTHAAFETGSDGARARVNLELSRNFTGGGSLRFGGFYDGIGLSDYESYGVEAAIDLRF